MYRPILVVVVWSMFCSAALAQQARNRFGQKAGKNAKSVRRIEFVIFSIS